MAAEDREKQFERALARHLSGASPASVCPDSEILAAYHERALSSEEMTRWKDHIASCARCQESLALVEKMLEQTENLPTEEWEHARELVASDDRMLHRGAFAAATAAKAADATLPSSAPASVAGMAAPREISKPKHRPPLRWIVPLGAVAAAVIVWIGVTDFRTARVRKMENAQIAENRPAPAPPPQLTSPNASLQAPALQDSTHDSELKPPSKVMVPRDTRIAPKQPPASLVANGATPVPSAPADDLARNDMSAPPAGVMGGVMGGVPHVRSVSPGSALAINGRGTNAAASAPVPAPQGVASQPNATPSVLAKEEAKKTSQQVVVSAENVAVDSVAQSENAVTFKDSTSQLQVSGALQVLDLKQAAEASRLYIVAPDEKHAWRVGNGGKIERTTDRGKTWKLQNSGVTSDLTAGSATSDKICWVVGKTGTLLLTKDGGKHWKQIATPITGDLGGVHATDARHVSIWDVPNRQSSQSSDGGVTWTRFANE